MPQTLTFLIVVSVLVVVTVITCSVTTAATIVVQFKFELKKLPLNAEQRM
jgi:hypothetical protein